jgi:tetratricopeptide (TPR) repeat protein
VLYFIDKEDIMKQTLGIIILLCVTLSCFCSSLDDANDLVNQNKWEEALVLYETALAEDPVNEDIYLNIALVHEKLKDWEKALAVLKKGLSYAVDKQYSFYFQMGNINYKMGSYSLAVEMYTKSIVLNSDYPQSYLNRGNGKLKLATRLDNIDDRVKAYKDIILDYETFLSLYPDTSKRKEVEDLINALKRNIKNKEQREKDLENLLDILNSTTDSTKDIKAGAEDIDVEYEDEDLLD